MTSPAPVSADGVSADPVSADPVGAARIGASMALGSMLCVQLGLAGSVGLLDQISAPGAAWLRVTWAAVILLILVRPRPSSFTRSSLLACAALGVTTSLMTLLFMSAVARLPLGTAAALEFLGPLSVAVARSRGRKQIWPALAAVGVVLLTQPWKGGVDLLGVAFALAAAACWAGYILLTQRVGDEVPGVQGLAVSMTFSAVTSSIIVAPFAAGQLTAHVVLASLGLAVLLPVVPFTLELLALRRLTAAAFGTLMSLEPAFALLTGFVLLHQRPGLAPVVGVFFVVAAGVGAERTGARTGPRTGSREPAAAALDSRTDVRIE